MRRRSFVWRGWRGWLAPLAPPMGRCGQKKAPYGGGIRTGRLSLGTREQSGTYRAIGGRITRRRAYHLLCDGRASRDASTFGRLPPPFGQEPPQMKHSLAFAKGARRVERREAPRILSTVERVGWPVRVLEERICAWALSPLNGPGRTDLRNPLKPMGVWLA